MSSLLYLSKCYASVLKSLNGQTDETFALRVLFTKELQRLRAKYKALVRHSSVTVLAITLAKAVAVLTPRGRLLNY
jgi:hypothetical protein